jgi:pyrimidine deaminase RibD-like protein
MEKQDREFMTEAIAWANDCHPAKESIPKVGAVFVVDGKAVGQGRRGTGKEGDDEHACALGSGPISTMTVREYCEARSSDLNLLTNSKRL